VVGLIGEGAHVVSTNVGQVEWMPSAVCHARTQAGALLDQINAILAAAAPEQVDRGQDAAHPGADNGYPHTFV
jgi:hypothetical protein